MRTRTTILLTAMILVCSSSAAPAGLLGGDLLVLGGGLTADQLRCEYRVDPLGVDALQPRLSWAVESNRRGQLQTGYRILVASRPDLLKKNTGDLWDTGKVASDESIQIPYAGKPLQSHLQCFWKVRLWNKEGKPAAWSKTACWTMGLLKPGQWRAQWIGLDASRRRVSPAQTIDLTRASWIWHGQSDAATSAATGTRYFRKEFTIPAGSEITSAACAIAADNSFTLFLNGRHLYNGNNFKDASVTEVAEHLRPGKNVLAIEATNVGDSPNPAGLLAVLNLRLSGGQSQLVTSDQTWRSASAAPTGWRDADFDAANWSDARIAAAYGAGPWGKVNLTSGQLFLPPAQFLRKRFVLDKAIERATIYASALGNYELYLNGRRIDDSYFTPGWTDYDKRLYYNTFDVTAELNQGFNVVGAILADGWYSGHIGWGRRRDHYGENPRLATQLHIEYADGTSKVITTNGTWKAATGPILEADFLMGEVYDATQEMAGWSTTEFNDASWSGVDVTDQIEAKIESYPGVLVRKFQEIKPVEITEPKADAYVFNLGTNFAGFVRLKVAGATPGQKIVLRFAERLNPDGTVYTTNLRGARVTDTYICKGQGKEVWQPRFTFHGFQYVEVTGYPGQPDHDAITGIELTSATPVVGEFTCSDSMANTLYRNICQTQRANFLEIPTDCPQRDERLGWMGDAQIYVRTATYNSDIAAFFTKWLVDVEDAQLDNGAFSDVSPRKVATAGGVAAWGDAGVICPWTIYQVYGDKRVLAKHYDAMQRWIDYCQGTTKGLLRPAHGYGDWLSIKADTPKEVLATAYFAYSTKLVARVAEVLGKSEDARKYQQLFEQIRRAFNQAYVGADGRIKGNTQTVYVLALAFDLLDEEKQSLAAEHLVSDIRDRNWHLSTGFVGTKDLMATLTRIGRTDVAYNLFHNDTFPSWGFSIAHGATSIWERWDGWTPEKGFQDPGMNSFAHYSFGAVCEWMFKTIGGIDTKGPAYKHIVIRPRPDGKLAWAKTSYNSIRGPIATSWKVKIGNDQGKRTETLKLNVTIPANTTATIYLPTANAAGITESGRSVMQAKDVSFVGTEGDNALFEIGSGVYKFTTQLK